MLDPAVSEETGLAYRQEVKLASLAKRRAKEAAGGTPSMSARDLKATAAIIAEHLLNMQS